jgi:hypothetical protein
MRDPQHHGVGRPRVGPLPKLSEIRCFYSFSRFRCARTPWCCGCRGGRGGPMGGGDGGTNGCVVGAGALGVFGPQKPKFSSLWVEKRLRNGSETARETAEFRPRSRPALLLEVMNEVMDVGSCIAIGPGIGEVEPCPCQGAPRAVFPHALP